LADIFREVDEDLQQENMARLWKRYGLFVIGGAVAIVIGTASWVFYKQSEKEAHAQRAESFFVALQDARDQTPADGLAVLDNLAQNAPDGFAYLAALQAGDAAHAMGNVSRAIESYERLERNPEAPALFRDMAALRAIQITMNQDGVDLTALRDRLDGLAADGRPYRYSARENMVMILLENGDEPGAKRLLEKLIDDPITPQGIRGRSTQLLESLGGRSENIGVTNPISDKTSSETDDKASVDRQEN